MSAHKTSPLIFYGKFWLSFNVTLIINVNWLLNIWNGFHEWDWKCDKSMRSRLRATISNNNDFTLHCDLSCPMEHLTIFTLSFFLQILHVSSLHSRALFHRSRLWLKISIWSFINFWAVSAGNNFVGSLFGFLSSAAIKRMLIPNMNNYRIIGQIKCCLSDVRIEEHSPCFRTDCIKCSSRKNLKSPALFRRHIHRVLYITNISQDSCQNTYSKKKHFSMVLINWKWC